LSSSSSSSSSPELCRRYAASHRLLADTPQPLQGHLSTCSHASLEPWGAEPARIPHALAAYLATLSILTLLPLPLQGLPKVCPNGDGRFDFCPPYPVCAAAVWGFVVSPIPSTPSLTPCTPFPALNRPLPIACLQVRLDPIFGCCPLSSTITTFPTLAYFPSYIWGPT
jgi:hypothetical protein